MEAHEQGIIHRDIKPPNIFLSDFQGEPDFVTVLDFGIAKPIAKEGDVAATALTAHGMPIGTPAYMAPELVKGEEPRSGLRPISTLSGWSWQSFSRERSWFEAPRSSTFASFRSL